MAVGLPLEGTHPPADRNLIHVENVLDGGFLPSEMEAIACTERVSLTWMDTTVDLGH